MIYKISISLVFLILFGLFTMLSNKIYKTIFNPITLFNVVWLLFGCIAMQGPYDFYIPQINTVIIIITAVITFNIVAIIGETKVKNKTKMLDYSNFECNSKLIILFNFIAYTYLVPHTIKAVEIILSSGWTQLRYCILNNLIVFTKSETIFCTMFIYPIFTATLIITAIKIVSRKMRPGLAIIAVVDIVLNMLTSGGRFMLFIFLILIIGAYFVNKNRKIYKLKFRDKCLLLIGIACLVYITMNRRIGDTSVFQNIVAYFIGPFAFFDRIVNNHSQFGLFENYGFGIATFGWIFSAIVFILKNTLNLNIESIDTVLSAYSGQYYNVSSSVKLNHTSNMLYPMLYDYGYLGPLIGTAIFAGIFVFVYKKARHSGKQQAFWISCAVYMTYIIFASSYEYILIWARTFFELFYLFVFCYASKHSLRFINRKNKDVKEQC